MATAPQLLDYAAYLRLPEIKRRYDIVDGVLRYMSPAPNWEHQWVLRNVFRLLDRHCTRHGLGEVALSPLDVIISKGPLRVRQPDVLFISKERLNDIVDERIHGGPDLVVEIVSPGNTPKHIQQKLRDYAAVGVREAWIAYPKQEKIAVLHPQGADFREAGSFSAQQRVRSGILPRLSFAAHRVFD
jgi:Uma2 family endonuclease